MVSEPELWKMGLGSRPVVVLDINEELLEEFQLEIIDENNYPSMKEFLNLLLI